jgi:hypothetical protein
MAAQNMIERYGLPDEVRPNAVTWFDAGPWKRIEVRNVRPPLVDTEDLGIIEETIAYPLAPSQAASVLLVDSSLAYNAREQQLSASADREELNYLRLNLADEVANGRATPEQARATFARVVDLEQSGKSSPYMRGLLFTVAR